MYHSVSLSAEVVPSQLPNAGRLSAMPTYETLVLTCLVDAANDCMVVHCAWEVERGDGWLLAICSDTDNSLLCFIPQL